MKQKWIDFEKHPSTSLKVLMPKILNIQKKFQSQKHDTTCEKTNTGECKSGTEKN